MSHWLFNANGYIDEEGEYGYREKGKEGRLPGTLYADDFVLFGKSEEYLRAMVGCFVGV